MILTRGCQDRPARHVSMVVKSLILGLIVAVAWAAGASAAGRPLVPQGNSGADQYVESIPTAAGQQPTISNHRNHSSSAGSSSASAGLSPSVQAALARQGDAGRRTAALARAYAPARRRSARRGTAIPGGGSSGGSSSAGGIPAGGAEGAPSASAMLVRSLTGLGSSGGLGAGLSVLLLLTALGAGVLAVVRRRRAG
jgi:hypothetical protein